MENISIVIEAIEKYKDSFKFSIADSINKELILVAFIIGFLGSLSYYTSVWFGFIGGDSVSRKIILKPFTECEWYLKPLNIIWYCFIGGFIAVVFQLPQSTFAPIQSFILGCSWPSIVIPFLSSRMYEASRKELDEMKRENAQMTANKKLEPSESENFKKIRDKILESL